jgi:hypothetical protein
MTNPLFDAYRASIARPDLVHETMTLTERSRWFAWIAAARKAFRETHPEYVEPNGGVKAEHHDVFVQFCQHRFPARKSA